MKDNPTLTFVQLDYVSYKKDKVFKLQIVP